MLRPVKMKQLNMLIFDANIDQVTSRVIRQGILHLAEVSETEKWVQGLEPVKAEEISAKYGELSKRIKGVLDKLGEPLPEAATAKQAEGKPRETEEIDETLEKIESELTPHLLEKETKEEELKTQQKIYEQVKLFGPLDLKLAGKTGYSFLETVTGEVGEKNLRIIKDELEPIPNLIMPFKRGAGKVMVVIIVLKKDKVVLTQALKESLFEVAELPEEAAGVSGDIRSELKKRIEKLKKEIKKAKAGINGLKEKYGHTLLEFLGNLRTQQLMLKAKTGFRKTARTYLISGWVPAEKKSRVIEEIRKLTRNRCYIEELAPGEVEAVREGTMQVPVQFKHPAFLKPFELLISNYGIPRYNAIDPTLFVAISFLIMFGAMFGDVGHGLVLFLSGLFLFRNPKPLFSKVGALILYCGGASILFGFLYGSIFGLENLIPALWLRPMHNVMHIFKLAIGFGVLFISLGIVINIINSLRMRDFNSGIFGKAGLVGGLFYWGAVGLICKKLLVRYEPLRPGLVLGVIGIPVLLILFREPIMKLAKLKEKMFPEGFMSYLIETMVELIEMVIGYLANTVSFIRIAAFALAHVGLFIAVFSLVDILRVKPGGIILSAITLILGNILIIALEGLIVTIQGMRLEYYEFFSKFFTGGGKEYKPIKMEKSA